MAAMGDAEYNLTIFGDEQVQRRARRALPLLVRQAVGLSINAPAGVMEEGLPSGDCVDVVFKLPSHWYTFEVKSSRSSMDDILRGLFQCLKYGVVIEAMLTLDNAACDTTVSLVLESKLPFSLVGVRNALGIRVLECVSPAWVG